MRRMHVNRRRWSVLLAVLASVTAIGTEEKPSGLPASDLRPEFERLGLKARRQEARPTCSVFTVAGAIEFAFARRDGSCPRLSVEFLNWAGNEAAGGAADGGFFSDLWNGFSRHGISTEQYLPYRPAFDAAFAPDAATRADATTRREAGLRFHWIKEWDVKTGLTDAQLAAIGRTLAAGWPVCGGFRWPRDARWVDGVLQMCPADAVYDGHSVLLVGCRPDPAQPGGGVFLFRNTAGDGRDGAMPFAYVRAYMNDAAWIEGIPAGR
jgi:hypothetical protein